MLDKKSAKTGTVHLGVTGSKFKLPKKCFPFDDTDIKLHAGLGCPRSRAATSLLSPRIDKTSTLEQLLIDLRTSDSLAWSSFVFLYDSSISKEAKMRVMAEIERDAGNTFSFHNLGNTDQVDRAKLNMLFQKIPVKDIGGKSIFAVSKDIVSTILEEVVWETFFKVSTMTYFC